MKLPESLFSRLLLAYLPFMLYPLDLFRSGVAALGVVLFLWITATFFWFTHRFFPERSMKPAFFLWLIIWAQAVWTVTKLPPFWILSVFFLMPVSFLEGTGKAGRVCVFSKEVPRYLFERVLAGVSFIAFVAILTLFRETCENRLGMSLADQPAVLLLALAAIAFLWKSQPFRGDQ
jgi:hypothetical protein